MKTKCICNIYRVVAAFASAFLSNLLKVESCHCLRPIKIMCLQGSFRGGQIVFFYSLKYCLFAQPYQPAL